MRSHLAIAGLLAVVVHALALLGPQRSTPARPLPLAPESLEVELTAALEEPAPPPEIPAPPEPEPAEPLPEPPPVETPPNSPIPEPAQEVVKAPEPETPRPPPTPKAKPKPATGVPKPATPPAKPPAAKAGPASGIRVRSNPAPTYPSASRQAHQEGTVWVDVQVSAAGLPLNVTLASSSGFPALDQAALAAVRRWRFEPAKNAGIPVAGRARVPVRFQLAR